MEQTNWTNTEIYNLLCRIDQGYEPSEGVRSILKARPSLILRDKMIRYLPKSVGLLSSLKYLDLSDNQIPELPETLGQLQELQTLCLSGMQFKVLPEAVCRLPSLQVLDLSFTPIRALPEAVGQLTALEVLSVYGSEITALPESLRRLPKLRYLKLGFTPLSTLPDWIGELPALMQLDLCRMKLDAIPDSLARKGLPFRFVHISPSVILTEEPGVWCSGMTLRDQDISIFEAGSEAITQYYADSEKTAVRETRLVFLGDGGVGKSYTIRRIRNGGRLESAAQPYVTHETPGVEIADLTVQLDDGPLELHLWDFGGQEILHSMHRCFLTGKTVYLVMVDTRHGEANWRARYWLRNVQSFAEAAPVLLMLNCWDQDDRTRVLEDEYYLKQEYPNLQAVVRVNAKYDSTEDFCRFMDSLYRFAALSQSCTVQIDALWERARRRIREEARRSCRLSKQAYQTICDECGIAPAQRAALRNWLNILGVSFSYYREGEDEAEADYQLLDPAWLTNALYAIIREGGDFAEEGVIRVSAVERLLRENPPTTLNGEQYTRPRAELRYDRMACSYILKIAEQFHLAYRINEKQLFFPALCQQRRPQDVEPKRPLRRVRFEMDYEYLPDSVVHQLMVACRKREELVMKHCWFHGFVLRGFGGLTAVVQMQDDRKLSIEVFAEGEAKAWPLLKAIHDMLAEVNARLSFVCREYILAGRDRFTWKQLLRAWERGFEEIPGDEREYSVSELLGDIYSNEDLARQRAAAEI